ncbi:P-selectin-like isoform X5 [Malaclemys terrapin pileata]|uniref:P-selectin-like isoform X5 n=1 Tax=Malaclemys terrapin pileata TaxID=2991368 RepID=UPI0023A88EBB|nr:P-selectin-like isoform X5 [Malaclemys terrapin pileata]
MGSTVGLRSSPRAWGCGWNVARLLCFAAICWVLGTQMEVGAWTYHYGNKSDYSWELARNFCRSFYTDLVAIQNQGEIVYLNKVLPRHRTYYWIGIRKINNVWTWVGTNKALTKEAENWANKEPNNKGKNQDCVEIYIKRDRDAGRWNDENCQKKKRALCYQAVKCPALATLGRGQLNCTHWHGHFTYNSTCTFSCEMGFVRNGSETLACTALGQWTVRPPLCEAVKCPVLDSPGRGRLNCTHWHGDFTYNSTCAFSCETGFVRNGSETLECTALGQWTGHPPRCEAVKCPVLAASERGRLNCTHWHGDFTYNSTCAFSCETGFVRNGSETVECTALGQWTGHSPRCEAVKCPVLDSPGRGQLNCTHWHGDFTYNSTCAFSCETGFVRNGSETLECTALGQWTGRLPRCEAVKCPVLAASERGRLNCTHWHGDFTYNSTCAFSCETGFVRNGSETVECTALGQWTGHSPRCEAVKCPVLDSPGRGRLNCTHWHGDFTYNSTCAFSCEMGFVRNGSETLECTALGQWTGRLPRCEAVTCPGLAAPGRGRLNCTHWHGDFMYNSTCAFSCETGFVRNGSETVECTALGQWTGHPPRCEVMRCPKLRDLEPILMNCSHPLESFSYGSVCRFRCTQGYFLNGTSRVQCQPDGHWSDKMPACQEEAAPYFKQVLLYMGGGAVALVALLLTGMFIALLIKRLSNKEEEKTLLNPTSNLGAPGVFTNAAFDSNF